MARRKKPETPEEWRTEIVFHLLSLVRSRKLPPGVMKLKYFALRDLAKIHNVAVDEEFSSAWEEMFGNSTRREKAKFDAKPEEPVGARPDGPQETGGSIFDEMGEE